MKSIKIVAFWFVCLIASFCFASELDYLLRDPNYTRGPFDTHFFGDVTVDGPLIMKDSATLSNETIRSWGDLQYESYLKWGGTNVVGGVSPLDAAAIDSIGGNNKFAFLPTSCVNVAYSTNGGTTWTDYGASDVNKIGLTTLNTSLYLGGANEALTQENATNLMLRIRINSGATGTTAGTQSKIYTQLKKLLINCSSPGGAKLTVDIRYRTIANYLANDENSWSKLTGSPFSLYGQSGWNSIPCNLRFGGYSNQTGYPGEFEFTFYTTVTSTASKSYIRSIYAIGTELWMSPSYMASKGHIYTYDAWQNATFPNSIGIAGPSIFHGSYTYALPSKTGTLALTSDVDSITLESLNQNDELATELGKYGVGITSESNTWVFDSRPEFDGNGLATTNEFNDYIAKEDLKNVLEEYSTTDARTLNETSNRANNTWDALNELAGNVPEEPEEHGFTRAIYNNNGTITTNDYDISGEITNGLITKNNLVSIDIGTNVTSIGNSVFINCTSLTNAMIPDSVLNIGEYAFYGCNGLTWILIPDTVTNIAKYAFYDCDGLSSMVIPDGVTSIGQYAFYGCSNLEKVTIGTGLTSVESYAFAGCTNLKTIYYIHSENETSDERKFFLISSGCPENVTYIDITGIIQRLGDMDPDTGLIPASQLNKIIEIVEITITNFVKKTGDTIFGPLIINNTLSQGILTSASGDYSHAEGALTSASGYGSHAEGAGGLGILILSINAGAKLYFIQQLKNILNIGVAQAKSIADSIESGNQYLLSFETVEECDSAIQNLKNYTSLMHLSGKTESSGIFSHSEGINSRADGIASHTEGINSFSTNDYSFVWNGDSSITNYSHGDGTFNINPTNGLEGFYIGNTNLSYLLSSNFIAQLDEYGVGIQADPNVWNFDERPAYDGDGLATTNELNNYIAKEELANVLEEYSTVDARTLNETSNRANNTWDALNELAGNEQVGETILYFNDGTIITTNIVGEFPQTYRGNTTLTNVVLGANVTSIGGYAFRNCSGLTSVTIPTSVAGVGNSAFENCTDLTRVDIPAGVTYIGNYAFGGCTNLTNSSLSANVKSIGVYAFNNSGLTSMTIPSSVTSIGSSAFEDCSNLVSVTIGDNVTTIGGYAFSDCSNLTTVVIPDSVTSIVYGAFRRCSNLKTIYYTHSNEESSETRKTWLKSNNCPQNATYIDITDLDIQKLGDMDPNTELIPANRLDKIIERVSHEVENNQVFHSTSSYMAEDEQQNYTIKLENGNVQHFESDDTSNRNIHVILPSCQASSLGILTIYLEQNWQAHTDGDEDIFTISTTNIKPSSFPADPPWMNTGRDSTWEIEFKSPPGTTQWYYIKSTEYDYSHLDE